MKKCTFTDCRTCCDKETCEKDEKRVANVLQIMEHEFPFITNPDQYYLALRAKTLLDYNPNACDEVEAIRLVMRLSEYVSAKPRGFSIDEGIIALGQMIAFGIFLDSDNYRADRVNPFYPEAANSMLANCSQASSFLLQCSKDEFDYLIRREIQGYRAQNPVTLPHRPADLRERKG